MILVLLTTCKFTTIEALELLNRNLRNTRKTILVGDLRLQKEGRECIYGIEISRIESFKNYFCDGDDE